MDVLKLVKELSEQFGTEIIPVIKMTSLPERAVGHQGGGYNQLLSKDTNTTIRDIRLDLTYARPSLHIHLNHNGCTRWTSGRIVKNVPHYCKYCGVEALSKADAAALGVPVNEKAKQGLEISIIGPGHPTHHRVLNKGFAIHNLYHLEDTWWHLCDKGPGKYDYRKSRMTVKKFPHTCKKCKMVVGAENFSLNTAFKLPHFVGSK